MSKADYNKGVASGMKVAQKFVEKEVEALNFLQSKMDMIGAGQAQMNAAVYRLIDDADEKAIREIYGICNPIMPKDLQDHEKKILLDIVASLGAVRINATQKRFSDNLRHHLDVRGYEPNSACDLSIIGKIETVGSSKVIAKALRLFLFLESNSLDSVYSRDEDLFVYFELSQRTFDEIDSQIELLYCLFEENGLIEFYGDFGEEEYQDTSYLHPEEKEFLEVSHTCAQVYFSGRYAYDATLKGIESASYVLYGDSDKIMMLHKTTGQKFTLLENVESGSDMIAKAKITVLEDIAFYVFNHDLFYLNLDTKKSVHLLHIEENTNDDGEVYEVCGLKTYTSHQLIYRNGDYYLIDLANYDTIKICCGGEQLYGDSLYFSEPVTDIDDNIEYTKYRVRKYGLQNNTITNVSKPFARHKWTDGPYEMYNLFSEGIYQNHLFLIYEYQSAMSADRLGFECFCFNLDDPIEISEKLFFIWNSHIYQLEQYKNYLIYVNADKGYSLIKHDFLTNKKTVLLKGYGQSEKQDLSTRLFLGKGEAQHPRQFMRLGKWLWVREAEKFEPRLIEI